MAVEPARLSSSALIEPFLRPGADLPREQVEQLVQAGEVLDYKEFERPSVVRWTEADHPPLIVKLWYRKEKISSDLLYPYSTRFKKNTDALRARGFRAPEVIGWGRVEPGHIRFVSYRQLPGETLDTDLELVDLAATARFVLTLHEAGIDFRGLHLGNILLDDQGNYGVIDVADCRFSRIPLPRRQRARRLARFCNHTPERDFFNACDRWSLFVTAYCEAMGLSEKEADEVRIFVRANVLR